MRSVFALILSSGLILAQSRGTISGEVTDPAGAAVPNAKVTVKAREIGITRETATTESGLFTISPLPPSGYEVAVEAAGFKTLGRQGIRLDSDASVSLKLRLEVGQLTEQVQVTAEAPLVEVANGEIARQVTKEQLQAFALAGRNPYNALGILPGVVSRYGNFLSDFRGGSYSMGGLQINGHRKDTNFVTIDGVTNNRQRDGVQTNNILGVDFIEEVKVHSSHYAPEFGRTTGANISYTTRRGTRDLHGSVHEFYFSEAFSAQAYVVGGRPRIRYHNYGFTLGGPVMIPKVFNTDKSKLYFFVGLEGRYTAGSNQKLSLLPTALERAGNFSATRDKPVDPLSGAAFPGDIIPASRISRVGRAIQKVFPDPNYTGPGGNYFARESQPTESRDLILRGDYNIKQNWLLTFRALPGQQDFTSPFDNTGNNIPLFRVYRDRRGNNYNLALTTTINASSVNEIGLGYSDYREDFRIIGDGVKRAAYGFDFPEVYPGNRFDRIPNVNIAGFTGFSGSGQPSYGRTPTWIFRDNYSRVIGSHFFKAGLYMENLSFNELNQANDSGTFSFGNTQANPLNSRNAWANALLGNFDAYSESSSPVQTVYRSYVREFYAQDSWKIRPRLTIEYGIRYSLIAPWGSRWNNQVAFLRRFWDPSKAPQVAANGSIVNGTGDIYNGIVLPGSGFSDDAKGRFPQTNDPDVTRLFRGLPNGFNPVRKTNFQPRLSFAWDVFGNGRTAVRGGAGVFHGVQSIANSGWYLGARPPFVQAATITNGFADNPASGIANNTRFPIDTGALPDEYKIPTVYNYSFGIQHQLPMATVLDVSYVGNSGRQLSFARPLNFLTPAQTAQYQGVDTRQYLPYRGLGGINLVEPSATSSYNSLQVSARRRTGQVTYSVAYTLGKIIGYGNEGVAGGIQNPVDRRSERSELEESRRHYAVIMHTWELPWHKAQRGLIGRVVGGWSMSGVWTLNSGRLFAPTLTPVPRGIAQRPDVVGSPYLDPRTEPVPLLPHRGLRAARRLHMGQRRQMGNSRTRRHRLRCLRHQRCPRDRADQAATASRSVQRLQPPEPREHQHAVRKPRIRPSQWSRVAPLPPTRRQDVLVAVIGS